MATKLTAEHASEHIGDSIDQLRQANKTLKNVQLSFPTLATEIDSASKKIEEANKTLAGIRPKLDRM